jgi:hypothetical protein
VDANSPDGWSVIMPAWNSEPGRNRWHLSVVVEDKTGQRVSSNEIALALTEPLVKFPAEASPGICLRKSAPDGPIPPLQRGI